MKMFHVFLTEGVVTWDNTIFIKHTELYTYDQCILQNVSDTSVKLNFLKHGTIPSFFTTTSPPNSPLSHPLPPVQGSRDFVLTKTSSAQPPAPTRPPLPLPVWTQPEASRTLSPCPPLLILGPLDIPFLFTGAQARDAYYSVSLPFIPRLQKGLLEKVEKKKNNFGVERKLISSNLTHPSSWLPIAVADPNFYLLLTNLPS